MPEKIKSFQKDGINVAPNNKLRLARRKREADVPGDDTPGISPADIASHNSRAALEILRRAGPQTRLELSARLRLTEPAIAGIMARLLDAGHVSQRKRSGTGRYVSTEYLLVAESAYAVGISWSSATGGRTCLIDLAGNVVAAETFASLQGAGAAVEALLATEQRRARCRGIAVSVLPGIPSDLAGALAVPDTWQVRAIDETEAAVVSERIMGVGERDGGIVVILIGANVRAGLLIGGKFFKGEHGRAGNIGAMRTGDDRIPLDDILGIGGHPDFLRQAKFDDTAVLDAWADRAAGHLKDVVIAIGGFLSPGLILIGGDIPTQALDAIIAKVNRQTREFIASFSVPEMVRSHFADGGAAEGAAASVFLGDLLPDLALMDTRED